MPPAEGTAQPLFLVLLRCGVHILVLETWLMSPSSNATLTLIIRSHARGAKEQELIVSYRQISNGGKLGRAS